MATSQVPKPPPVLKNGYLSKDRRQLTTYETYMQAIREGHHDTAYYEDYLEELRQKPNPFFQRDWEVRTPAQIRNWLRSLREVLREIPQAAVYPNFGYECRFCSYEPPCHAIECGADLPAALELYRVRQDDAQYLEPSKIDWSSV